jgi:dTDP-4-dehydrorhamnose reductase
VAVLITGGGGQLASDLVELIGCRHDVVPLARSELDITDVEALAGAFERVAPSLVINCAAFHNLDVCEREEDRSFEVNARAVKRIAEHCAAAGARLVHVSTNYVFDGHAARPYTEADRPSPRSVYAISKLAGEQMALAYCPGALVVRSAGLYGMHGSASKGGNFVTRMLARAREQGQLRMVADQRLTPTFTADLAAAIVEAVDARLTGVLHLTNGGACSWHEFTAAIMDAAGMEVQVAEATTTRPPGGVDRPLNGVLANERAARVGLVLRPWQEALADYMSRAGLIAAGTTR